MSSANPIRQCRRPAVQAWVGAVLVALLLVAEVFAVTHPYDTAAHGSDRACSVCLSTASFGAGAVAVPVTFEASVTAAPAIAAAIVVLVTLAPIRRYARGPPRVSFPR